MAEEPESQLQQRIRERLRELGTNPFRAAVDSGLKPDTIRNLLRPGKAVNPRADTMKDVARALRCSVAYLTGESDTLGDAPAPAMGRPRRFDTFPLTIRHKVAAGHWLELDQITQAEPRDAPLRSDPRWPATQQWCSEVEGESMNEVYPPGTVVRLVSVFALRAYVPRQGDHVEVVRKRNGGQYREVTLKEIEVDAEGNVLLACRSTAAAFKGVTIPYRDGLEDDDEAAVEITGVVTGDFRARQFDF